ncbi:MAG TPA: hypothetical protein VGH81_10835, partial [Rudaea sp.]
MLTILFSGIAYAAIAGSPPLDPSPCEFGETYQLSEVHCTVAFTNKTDHPVNVIVASAQPTDSIKPATATIASRATAYFDAISNVEHDLGRSEHWFSAVTDDEGNTKRYARASGFVMSVLDAPKPEIDFDAVQAGVSGPPAKSLTFASREVGGLRLKSVLKTPPYIDVHIDDGGTKVTVNIRPSAPWGVVDEYVSLQTNTLKQPSIELRIRADVHGEVVPSSNPFALGVMRQGRNNEALIRLTSRSGEDFQVGKIEFDNVAASSELLPCQPAVPGCK